MRLEKCWFCSGAIYPVHGVCFVRNDSKLFRFCRSKCHKNFKMKRNPRKVKWTKAYRALHGKEAMRDSAFEFERQRNRPRRYDRKVAQNTILAMRRVEDIKARRAERFHEMRMGGKEYKSRGGDKRELEQQIHLVRAPVSVLASNAVISARNNILTVSVPTNRNDEVFD